MYDINTILVAGSLLVLLGVIASKISGRFGLPALLLFLLVGMMAGSEGPGKIYFDNYLAAQSFGIIALALILFDGGLRTDFKIIKATLWPGLSLSTFGVAITALCFAVFAKFLLELDWKFAILLGAIVSSTDAAAVFSILRSKGFSLRRKSQALLELESGSNDPMAIFFTVATISLIQHGDGSVLGFATMFSQQLIFGVTLGLGAGQGLVWTINRIRLPYDGLYPVFLLASVLLLYAGTSALGGSGFLAVYLAGLMLSKHDFIHKNSLLRFHDGLAWIMQIGIFLVLGLLVFPSQLLSVVLSGSILAFFLMFVARPISVFLSLAGARFSSKEKLMISWVGLRGATPIILATFPLMAGLPQADLLFNMVFFIVLISVIIQGMSIPTVAKWLDVAEPFKPDQRPIFEFSQNEAPDKRFEEFFIVEESALCDKAVVELGLPHGALIVMISRGNYHFVPRGDTLIHAADRLLMIFNREDEDTLRQFMAS